MAKKEKIDINIDKLEEEIKAIRRIRHKSISNKTVLGVVAIVGLAALILIIALMLGEIEPSGSAGIKTCHSDSCFIKAANNCEPAIYNTRIESLALRFESTKDCKLIKKVIDVDDTEPEKIQELFLGTTMVCPFQKGDFNKKYIEQISYDMLTCKGNLVEAIKKIL